MSHEMTKTHEGAGKFLVLPQWYHRLRHTDDISKTKTGDAATCDALIGIPLVLFRDEMPDQLPIGTVLFRVGDAGELVLTGCHFDSSG